MNEVFCDTSGFLALISPSDTQHAAASAAWEKLIGDAKLLVTTNYVMIETIALIQARFGIDPLGSFLDEVAGVVRTDFLDERIHDRALIELLTHRRRHLNLVDCASFIYMRENRISEVFTFDSDFKEHGFSFVRV